MIVGPNEARTVVLKNEMFRRSFEVITKVSLSVANLNVDVKTAPKLSLSYTTINLTEEGKPSNTEKTLNAQEIKQQSQLTFSPLAPADP